MKKIPVYIASHFPNREMIKKILTATNNFGLPIEITSSWLRKIQAHSFHVDVGNDFHDIDDSEIVAVITPWYKGSMCETAYALGQNKPTVVLLDPLVDPNPKDLPPERYSDYFPLAKFKEWIDIYESFNMDSTRQIITWNMLEFEIVLKVFVKALGGLIK